MTFRASFLFIYDKRITTATLPCQPWSVHELIIMKIIVIIIMTIIVIIIMTIIVIIMIIVKITIMRQCH